LLEPRSAQASAVRTAADWLLERQDARGWWTAELETNVTMTAEHALLLRFLGLDLAPIREGAVTHILGAQRDDGTWGLYFDAPGDLSTTLEAYVALRVLGVDAAEPRMRRALSFIVRGGGLARARVFTRIWLALFGVQPWSGVPDMPPELIHLPPWAPFNLYDFACWARGTIAPLTIVLTRKPVRPLGVGVDEVIVPGTERELRRVPGGGVFHWLDGLLKLYGRAPLHPGRKRAYGKVARWVIERQEADGGWGGIQPPWVYSLIALDVLGYGVDHPVVRRGLQGLDGFSISDGGGWRLQACMSPVWDTAWAVLALRRAGLQPDDPAIVGAVDWLLGEQIQTGGDWQVRCRAEGCGGWAFEFANDLYPDVDDTAIVVLALLAGPGGGGVARAVTDAERWVLAMRSSNGAWASFDRDNTRELVYRLPFADFGALLDPPSEDVTAHVLEMLAALGRSGDDPVVARGIQYLRREQRPWGSWFGRWGVNHVYGTWCVVSALTALGAAPDMVARATDWMLSVQNPDGGWGESCHSYVDESFAGVGDSTPSQTAWAVMSLQSAGLGRHPAARAGLDFLRERQRDGTWDEPQFTGTGFPRDFYLNYHLYRHLFPLMALAGDET
jgi:squalene-hopene/tetraprenyl-beta-curcumene cyclase